MVDLEPELVAATAALRIVDIRTPEERDPPLGYIPSSRLFPKRIILDHPQVFRGAYLGDPPLVLTCMTGKRSRELVPMVKRLGFSRVFNLSGGLFAWFDAGLPVCGREPGRLPAGAPHTIEGIIDSMTSCFVVAAVESDLDNDLFDPSFNPRTFVAGLIRQEMSSTQDPTRAPDRALDRLGEAARMRGHSLENIAINLDHMRALVIGLAKE